MSFKEHISYLELEGLKRDSLALRKEDKYLNFTRDTGELLEFLVCLTQPKRILEVGTSNGFPRCGSQKTYQKKAI